MLNFVAEMKEQLILFISGGGSNARQIIDYFNDNERVNVVGVLSSKPNSEMEAFCEGHRLPFFNLQGKDFSNYLEICHQLEANWVVLAGFLKKIPAELIAAFPNKIINIHPSLLPNYGGAGMYGQHVHQAVSAANEAFSGISIHLVNEEFDKGKLLFQHAVALPQNATAHEVEAEVRTLEKQFFAKDLERFLSDSIK
jgi:phosphoribosylglycinamide formyltransferase-1